MPYLGYAGIQDKETSQSNDKIVENKVSLTDINSH